MFIIKNASVDGYKSNRSFTKLFQIGLQLDFRKSIITRPKEHQRDFKRMSVNRSSRDRTSIESREIDETLKDRTLTRLWEIDVDRRSGAQEIECP